MSLTEVKALKLVAINLAKAKLWQGARDALGGALALEYKIAQQRH
jgi:hypothetical protein